METPGNTGYTFAIATFFLFKVVWVVNTAAVILYMVYRIKGVEKIGIVYYPHHNILKWVR